MRTWHENDDFWELIAPMMFDEQCLAAASGEIDQMVALLGIQPEAAILDLCCGIGRHSLELARRGFRVTGIDRTDAYIEKAKKEAEKEALTVELVQDDMRHFCRPNTYDAAMMMFTSFGYFENPNENRQVLVNVYRSLKDKGALVMEMMGKEVLAQVFRERDWRKQNGIILLQERTVSRDWSWLENRLIILQGQDRHEFKMSHWLYSAAELSALLKESGFGSVDIYRDLEGAPYGHTAKRLVALAHK